MQLTKILENIFGQKSKVLFFYNLMRGTLLVWSNFIITSYDKLSCLRQPLKKSKADLMLETLYFMTYYDCTRKDSFHGKCFSEITFSCYEQSF